MFNVYVYVCVLIKFKLYFKYVNFSHFEMRIFFLNIHPFVITNTCYFDIKYYLQMISVQMISYDQKAITDFK